MVRVSTGVFNFINIFPFIIGLVTVIASIYLQIHGGTVCQITLRDPLLIIGIILFVISMLAFIGSCCNNAHFLLTLYSIIMVVIIFALTGFTIFIVVVTNKGVARRISGLGFREYRLDDYSGWLQHNFVSGQNWDRIRSCLSDSNVCKTIHSEATFSGFIKQRLSSIQSGCCKPPTYCKFDYKNATYWEMPESGPVVEDSDCRTWNNNQKMLCYNCKSCRGGVLSNIRKEWRYLAITNIIVLVVIIITFNIGCTIRKRKKTLDHDHNNLTATAASA
ncbi:Tetraspanin/Peripherin [Corchorus capsularis]|uniref:Tetraspanin/Peripherin n=1 Tax=Corchorus capsularis TaxID=210143 RepID=A0A1R3GS93_COCAP|nr:Tetraspanin/Peripherin [Corchorus capsularis]